MSSSETKLHQQKRIYVRMSLEIWGRLRIGDRQTTEEFEIRLVQSAILAFVWERQENQHHVSSAYIIPCNPNFIGRAMAAAAGRNLKPPGDFGHSRAL
jgi:hypothetical protein